jgi:hypothetical protein
VLLKELYELFKKLPKYSTLSGDARDDFNRALGNAHCKAVNTVVGAERKDAQFGLYVVQLYFDVLPKEFGSEYINKAQIEFCADKIRILLGEDDVTVMLKFFLDGDDDFEEKYKSCLEYIKKFPESMD